MLVPILFFSASQSKLPGYILPAVPAGALLVAEYLAARRSEALPGEEKKFSLLFAAAHGVLCGLLIFAALLRRLHCDPSPPAVGNRNLRRRCDCRRICVWHHLVLLSRAGLRLLRPVTMIAVVVSVAAVIRFAAPVIDATQSARPIAESIQAFSREPVPIALYHINRVQEYGLEFYLNRPAKPTKPEISRPQLTCWLPHKVRNPKSPNSFPDAE